MKNITVSVDEAVLHRARIRAALMNTSVSALVRNALSEIAGTESEFERLVAREDAIRQRIAAREVAFSGGRRLTREDVYARDALH